MLIFGCVVKVRKLVQVGQVVVLVRACVCVCVCLYVCVVEAVAGSEKI